MSFHKNSFETANDYITHQYGEVKVKRGRWRIIAATEERGGPDCPHELWHQCYKDDWDVEIAAFEAWSDWADRSLSPNWRCQECGKIPPASIVALYVMLEPEETSREIQDALQHAETQQKIKDDPNYLDTRHDEALAYLDSYGFDWRDFNDAAF